MLGFIYPSVENCKFDFRKLLTLQYGELEDFDFTDVAQYIYNVLSLLHAYNIMPCRYNSEEEVLFVIVRLINDLEVSDTSSFANIRVELCDDLFSLEIYIGV